MPISGAVTRKGLTTPLTRRVASICYLCAGAVYIVLRSSPTGSITLVSSLREIPTVDVLHHPFLFGEIPTWSSRHQWTASTWSWAASIVAKAAATDRTAAMSLSPVTIPEADVVAVT